jgi:hypothetical protein
VNIVFFFGNDPSAGSPTERIFNQSVLAFLEPLLAALSQRAFPPRRPQQESPFRADRLNLKQYHSTTPSLTVCVPSALRGQLGSGLSISATIMCFILQIVTIRQGITPAAALAVVVQLAAVL